MNHMKRVAHVTTLHRAMDIRVFHKECRSLAEKGWEVHLLAPHPPAEQLDSVWFHDVSWSTTPPRLLRIWRRLQTAYRVARRVNAHIYHLHDPELILVGFALKLRGAKVIYDAHEDKPRQALRSRSNPLLAWGRAFMWAALEALAKVSVDRFVAATPSIARGFPSKRTIIIHNFPRIEDFPGLQGNHPEPRRLPSCIVYAGGISRERGILAILSALTILARSRETHLVLLGGFCSSSLQIEAAQHPGWHWVRFLGWQPYARVVEELEKASVGLVLFEPAPNHVEALPNKLFEYMAAGLPILASDFPLWRDLLTAHRCGVSVDPLDPDAIAGALLHLLVNPAEAQEMGGNGRSAVLGQMNWNREAQSLITLYKSFNIRNKRP